MYVFRRPDLESCALVDVYTDPDEAEDWGKGGMVLKQCKRNYSLVFCGLLMSSEHYILQNMNTDRVRVK